MNFNAHAPQTLLSALTNQIQISFWRSYYTLILFIQIIRTGAKELFDIFCLGLRLTWVFFNQVLRAYSIFLGREGTMVISWLSLCLAIVALLFVEVLRENLLSYVLNGSSLCCVFYVLLFKISPILFKRERQDPLKSLINTYTAVQLLANVKSKADVIPAFAQIYGLYDSNHHKILKKILRTCLDFGPFLNADSLMDSIMLTPAAGQVEYDNKASVFIDEWTTLRDSEVYRKFRRLGTYLVAFGMLNAIRLPFKEKLVDEYVESQCVKDVKEGGIEKLLFELSTIAHSFIRMGYLKFMGHSVREVLENEDPILRYFNDYDKLMKRLDIDGHDINLFDLSKDCEALLRRGRTLKAGQLNNSVRACQCNLGAKLIDLKCRIATTTATKKPYPLLIFGDSSIGKSYLVDMLFSFYFNTTQSNNFNTDLSPFKANTHKYTRTFADAFWSSYAFQPAVLLDDLSFERGTVIEKSASASIREIISIINNVIFVTPQAELDKKGTVPCLARVVIATTNQKDLNAKYLFNKPAAALRRFPIVLTPVVKDEYCIPGTKMLRNDKFHRDAWLFKVEKTTISTTGAIVYQTIYEACDLRTLQTFMESDILAHETLQANLADSMDTAFNYCSHNRLVYTCDVCTPAPDATDEHVYVGPEIHTSGDAVEAALASDRWSEASHFSCSNCSYQGSETEHFLSGCVPHEDPELIELHPSAGRRVPAQPPSVSSLMMTATFYSTLYVYATYVWVELMARYQIPLRSIMLVERFGRHCRVKYDEGKIFMAEQVVKVEEYFANNSEDFEAEVQRRVQEYLGWSNTRFWFYRKYIRAKIWWYGAADTSFECLCITLADAKSNKHVVLAGVVATAISGYLAYRYFSNKKQMKPAGAAFSRDDLHFWHKGNTEDFVDLNQPQRSIVTDDLSRMAKVNTVLMYFENTKGSPNPWTIRGFIPKGQTLITNAHILEHVDHEFYLTITKPGEEDFPLTYRTTFKVTKDQFTRHPTKDLISFNHPGMRSYRDLTKYISNDLPKRGQGRYFGIDNVWQEITHFDRITLKYAGGETSLLGRLSSKERDGTCGGPFLIKMPRGNYIGGISSSLDSNREYVGVIHLTSTDLETLKVQGFSRGSTVDIDTSPLGDKIPLHGKSPLRHYSIKGNMVPLCSFDGKRKRFVTHTKPTPFADLVCLRMERELKFFPPSMQGGMVDGEWKEPLLNNLKKRCDNEELHDVNLWNECIEALTKDLLDIIDVSRLRVLTDNEALNGVPGVKYLDPLDRSTSGGLRWQGPKRRHLIEKSDGDYAIPPEMTVWMRYIEVSYLQGFEPNIIFDANLKDEAVSKKKADSNTARVFLNAPITLNLVSRRQFAAVCAELMRNRVECEITAGVNTYTEWGVVNTFLDKFGTFNDVEGTFRIQAGDYPGYDCRQSCIRMSGPTQVFKNLNRASGNFSEQDLIIQEGLGNTLSHTLVNFNGDLVESVGNMPSGQTSTLIWNCIVNMLDMRYCYSVINKRHPSTFREHVALQVTGDDNVTACHPDTDMSHTSLKKVLDEVGVGYTMADKETESIPYIPRSQVEYLKRNFTEIDGYIIGALNMDSIFKMLTTYTESTKVTKEEQWGSMLESANRELVLHGEAVFNQMRPILEQIVAEHPDLIPWIHPNFYKPWKSLFTEIVVKDYVPPNQILSEYSPIMSSSDVVETILGEVTSEEAEPQLEQIILHPASGTMQDTVEVQQMDNQEHVIGDTLETDPTFNQGMSEQADISGFLTRPVKIFSGNWEVGNHFTAAFNPWNEFIRNSAVLSKLDNYHLLRAQLKVTFMINGTPQHAGLAMVSYSYLNTTNEVVGANRSELVTRSQRPRVFLNPTLCRGGCLCLPFFYHKNYLDLSENDHPLGRINIDSFQPLTQLNGGLDGVTITAFAHMTEVVLTVPTSRLAMAPAAGMKITHNDEYSKDGPVSSVASAVAASAGALKKIPVIGAFARATEIGANTVGAVASLFGFSKPAEINDGGFMRNTPFHSMATTDGSDLTQKLTLTRKQELTVDPSTVGLPEKEDVLALGRLTSVESYFAQIPWGVADAVDDIIFSIGVTPNQYLVANTTGICPTMLHYASLPFSSWSGSLRYRFIFVGSQFTRGRIAFIYEPDYRGATDPGDLYNTNYVTIVDISETRDFTLEVPWMQANPYELCTPSGLPERFQAGFAAYGGMNGTLYVKVLNELVQPDGVTDCAFNVFLSGGDDFEFANPSAPIMTTLTLHPASGQVSTDAADTGSGKIEDDEDAPLVGSKLITLAPTPTMDELKPQVFYGEKLGSLRQLLKRYVIIRMINTSSAANFVRSFDFSMLPPHRQLSGGGPDTIGGGTGYNFGGTYLHYINGMFAAWRGGVRYKLDMNGVVSNVSVTRFQSLSAAATYSFTTPLAVSTVSSSDATTAMLSEISKSGSGVAMTNVTQRSLEFEVPYALGRRYSTTEISNSNVTAHGNIFRLAFYTGEEGSAICQLWVAAADDYQVFGCVGAPVFYIGSP